MGAESVRTSPPNIAVAYATMYPSLAAIAREHGYALALHGSMARDMDLIAVPWTEEAGEPEDLIAALQEYTICYLSPADKLPVLRPHGRKVWSLHFETGGSDYIDLSVMPRLQSPVDTA